GYGSMRLFKLLDENLLGRSPKIFIGYSDMTALSLYFYRRFGWVTFHGPMAAKDLAGGEEHYDRETLIKAVTGAAPLGEIKSNKTEMLHPGSGGRVSGRLVGGFLAVVARVVGAPAVT